MSQIFDPTSNAQLDPDTCLTLPVVEGYQPVLSPKTGLWFAVHQWSNDSVKIDTLEDDKQSTIMRSIVRYELTEELVARAEMMRALGEEPSMSVNEGRHDHDIRVAAFSAAVARGYTHAEIHHAYGTLDRLTELAEATLGARHMKTDRAGVSDSITVTPVEPEEDDAPE